MKCRSIGCDAVPVAWVFWPGQTGTMCALCALSAQNIATAMGFRLTITLIAIPVVEVLDDTSPVERPE